MANIKPSMQWYPADYLKDEQVQKSSASTRGIWVNFLCYMWNAKITGKIKGTQEEMCRLGACTVKEFENFLTENRRNKFCKVTDSNKNITVTNRRMYREYKAREDSRLRQQKYKAKRKSNTEVTPYSSITTSLNNNKGVTLPLLFERARKIFPGTKRGHQTEYENFQKHKDWESATPLLLPAVEQQASQWKSEGTLKKYIPHFKTWINQRRWEQTDGVIVTTEQKAETEQQALEKKRQEIRAETGEAFRMFSTEKLQAILKDKYYTPRHWLIDEILKERKYDNLSD